MQTGTDLFRGKRSSKIDRSVKNARILAQYGSCTLPVMGSCLYLNYQTSYNQAQCHDARLTLMPLIIMIIIIIIIIITEMKE